MLEDMVISPTSLNDEPILTTLVFGDKSEPIASDGIGVEPINDAGSLVVSLDVCKLSIYNVSLLVVSEPGEMLEVIESFCFNAFVGIIEDSVVLP